MQVAGLLVCCNGRDFSTGFWSVLLAVGLVWCWSAQSSRVRIVNSVACVAALGIAPRWAVDLFLWLDDPESARFWADETVNSAPLWVPLLWGAALAIVVRVFDPQGRPGRIDVALVTGLSMVSIGPRWIAELCKVEPTTYWLMLVLSPTWVFGVLALSANTTAVLDWLLSPRFDWRRVFRYAMGIAVLAAAALLLDLLLLRSEISLSYGHVALDYRSRWGALALGVMLFGATRLATVRNTTS